MKIKRIIPNIAAQDTTKAKAFYGDLLGLPVVMDMGWIVTFEADALMHPQLSIAADGGSDAAVPDLTVEVDDLQEALRRFQQAGIAIERTRDGTMGGDALLRPRPLWTAA